MKTISRDELLEKLRVSNEEITVDVTVVTVPQMNKKVNGEVNPFYGRVKKRTRRFCVIGFHYGTLVNQQRESEGKAADFEAKPRKWGVPVLGIPLIDTRTPLIEHNGKFYLECKVESVLDSHLFLDDEPVDEEVVEPYLGKRKQSSRQDVDIPVVLITPELENIEIITLFDETYEILKEEGTV